MSKIIIDNQTETIDDANCLKMVDHVIAMGRISDNGKSYCYATAFGSGKYKIMVFAKLNKTSDTFTIREVEIDQDG